MVAQVKTRLRVVIKNTAVKGFDVLLVSVGFIVFHQVFSGLWSELQGYAAAWAGCFFLLLGNALGLYDAQKQRVRGYIVNRLLVTWTTTLFALLLLAYATKTSSIFSRLAVASWIVATPVMLWVLRKVTDAMYKKFSPRIGRTRKVAIAGAGENAARFIKNIQKSPDLKMEITGIYCSIDEDDLHISPNAQENIKGRVEQLIADVKQGAYDEVYIALSMSEKSDIAFLVQELSDCSVPVYFIPDIFTLNIMSSQVYNLNGIPLVSVYDTPMDNTDMLIKRTEDIVLGLIIMAIAALPMLLIALIIKMTSSGSVIFRQRRYGLGGEPIEVWKFRSMTVSEDGNVVKQAQKNDPRVTPFGAFLRRTSLDELPQFINVITGEMSIVGPRPHPVAHNELYRKAIQGYMLRHLVKPGITGWAQINGWRGETDTLEKMEKRVQYDLEYIKNWSLWFDLKIIALTVFGGFAGKNAY